MKNLNSFISFFIFFLFIFSIFGVLFVCATQSTISNSFYNGVYPSTDSHRSIVSDSNGRLITAYFTSDISNTINYSYSSDSGLTWSNTVITLSPLTNHLRAIDLCITSKNVVYIAYTGSNTGGGWDRTYVLKVVNDVVVSNTLLTASEGYSLSIVCDKYDNVIVTTCVNSWMLHNVLQTWTSINNANPYYSCLSSDTDSNANLYIMGLKCDTGDIKIFNRTYGSSVFTSSLILANTKPALVSTNYVGADMHIYNNVVYFTYINKVGTTYYVNMTYGNVGSWTTETVYSSTYEQRFSSISISSDGHIHILWCGTSVITANYQLMGKEKIGTSWSILTYYTSGTTDKSYTRLLYTNYPSFTHLLTGFACTYVNSSKLSYIDSGNIIFQSDNVGENSGCDISSFTSYKIPDGDMYYHAVFGNPSVGAKYIEESFKYYISGYVKSFELPISRSQVTAVSNNASDYRLFIDGVNCGSANIIYERSNGAYYVKWCNLNVNMSSTIHTIELGCDKYYSYGGINYYWYGIGINTGSNTQRLFMHTYDAYFGNGIIDGIVQSQDYQIVFNIYYASEQLNPNYNDSIIINSESKTFNSYTPISYTVTVSRNDIQNYLRLWKNGVKVLYGGFNDTLNGLLINVPKYVYSNTFTPFGNTSGGNYNLTLYRNNIEITSTTFKVVQTNPDFAISSYPNPVGSNTNFNIQWLNNGGVDLKLVVSLSSASAFFDTIKENINSYFGNVSYSLSTDGTYYIYLCTIINGTVTTLGNRLIQYVGIHYNSELHTNPTYYFTKDSEYVNVKFWGTVGFAGQNVYIVVLPDWYVSGNLKKYVEFSDISVKVYKPGMYEAYLVLWNGTWSGGSLNDATVLDEIGFTVYPYEDITNPDNPDNKEPIFGFEIPTEYGLIIGVILTVVFTLLPLIISAVLSRKTNISVINIPSLVYVGMFLLGVIISVSLTLFPIWVIFFVLFALILAFAIIWVQRKIAE